MEKKSVTFTVFSDGSGPDAHLDDPGPDTPIGTLSEVRDHVDAHEDEFDVVPGDELFAAGVVVYRPGKQTGEVLDIKTY